MHEQLAALRGFDLREFKYTLPDAPGVHARVVQLPALASLSISCGGWKRLLPPWSNNLSGRYFSHARTLPITIGQ